MNKKQSDEKCTGELTYPLDEFNYNYIYMGVGV